MKILHTSDWHLGHNLYGYDRTEEQRHALLQIIDIVRQERPDIFLLCGDVYDTPQPSAAVQTLFNKTIVQLHDACPQMIIVVTAGNHDSAGRHEIFRTPWEYLNVHMIGTFRPTDTDSHIIEIPEKGYVVAIPYTHERNLQGDVIQTMLSNTLKRNTSNLPVIMMAHTSVSGADYAGHDNATDKTIGGIDAVEISHFGTGYDYLALGHIHRPQFIHTGRHNVRYSGSPIPVSFDENYEHSVSIVEIGQHGDTPVVRPRNIENLHPLTTLPLTGYATWDEAKQLLKDFPDELKNYIRLNVVVTDILPQGAQQEAQQLCQNKKCRFCNINACRQQTERQATKQLSVQEFQKMSPAEVARMYAEDTQKPFDEDMQQMLLEALQSLNDQLKS